MSVERRKILFSGRVQGVGFRMTAVELAGGLQLAGTVRNLVDNTVELIAEGEAEEIDHLVNRLREHFGSFIRTIDQTRMTPIGNLAPGIRITY
ncbi:MAG: acylphosphatase [Phycisphaerales bacterium]|nr:acylphosphatase [Phycisphaerales bacterium]